MITAKQRENRRNHIGSSDAPAIVGLDPWRSPADVYFSKLAPMEDRPTEAMMKGNRLESALLDFAEESLGPIERSVEFVSEQNSLFAANLDGLCLADNAVVEAKYVGPNSADYWGEPESDEVPDHVSIQVQHQMFCAGMQRAHIVAGIIRPNSGLSWEMFHVQRDEDLIQDVIAACNAFWHRYVAAQVPPPNSVPALETLKRLRRNPASVCVLGPEAGAAILRREKCQHQVKEAEGDLEEATAELLAMLGDAECGHLPDGREIWYREENAGDRFDLKAFAKEYPETITLMREEGFITKGTRRVLRIKKGTPARV